MNYSGVQKIFLSKKNPIQKMSLANLSNFFNKKLNSFVFKNGMLLCLNDAKKPTDSLKFKKITRSRILQIANENEKLDSIMSQVNAS